MIRFSIVGQEAVGDVLPARHAGGERRAGDQQPRAEHEVGLAREDRLDHRAGSARARTGRRGGASRRRRRRAAAPRGSRSSGCRRSRRCADARRRGRGSSRASSHGLVGGGVVDQDHLVDRVARDRGDGRLAASAAAAARASRRSTLGPVRSASGTAGLNVDGSAAPQRHLERRAGERRPAAARAGGERGDAPHGPRSGRRCAPRAGGGPGRGRGRPGSAPTRPSSQPMTICPPRMCETRSTRSPRSARPAAQRSRRTGGRGGGARSRCSQRRRRPRLEAGGVRHRDRDDAAGREQPRGLADRRAGLGQVLERVPEDDRRPLAARSPRSGRRGRPARIGSRSSPIASRPRALQGVEQRAVAGADVEHRAGRGDPISRRASRRAGAAQQARRRRSEPASGLGPVPGPVGGRELVLGGPGVGRRGAARRAADAAPQPGRVAGERRPAPDARRGRGRRRQSWPRARPADGPAADGHRVERSSRRLSRARSPRRRSPRHAGRRRRPVAAQQRVVEPLRALVAERGGASRSGSRRSSLSSVARSSSNSSM